MTINQILARGFQECVGASWLRDRYTDFTLKVQDTTFKCHRFVLSACSEFFRAMLESGMRESQENSATIEDVDENTFSTILHALYTGVDGLDQDNVYQVWLVVHRLQISHMVRCCEDFVIRNISKENYFKIYQHAKLLGSNSVLKKVANFMIKNFEVIRIPETLQALSPEDMYTVLQSNNLKAESEDSVVESIITWVKLGPNSDNLPKYSETGNTTMPSETSSQETVVSGSEDKAMKRNQQADDRAKHLKKLFSVTRLYLVSPECLGKALRFATTQNNSSDACQLLIDAMMYQQNVEHEQFVWPTPAIHRATSDKEHVIVFWNSGKKEFQVYRLQRNAICKTSMGCPAESEAFLGFCVHDNHLFCSSLSTVLESERSLVLESSFPIVSRGRADYICDGLKASTYHSNASDSNCMYVITINNKSWINVGKSCYQCYEDSRYVAHRSNLYRLEGWKLQRFSPIYGKGFVGKWETHFEFSQSPRATSSVIVFRDSLILFPSQNSDVVWLDLNLKKEQKVAPIEGPVHDMVAFCNKDDTYILQRNGFLRKIISPNAGELSFDFITKLWTVELNLRGALLFRDQLFVFGSDFPADAQINVSSLEGVFQRVKVVNINSKFPCWPMIIPKSWLN